MALDVVSGRFYRYSIPKSGSTSLTDRQLVFVLFSQFNEGLKESLVAHAIKRWGEYEPDTKRVYVVPWNELEDFEQPVKEGRLTKAKKDLEKKIKGAN